MKTKSQLSSMLFFICLGCPASQPKDIQESKNNVSESSVSPATTPIEPNKSTYYEPQKVVPAPTPVKDVPVKNNDNLKTAGIIGAGALGLGALYLAHKKLTTKAQQDLKDLVSKNKNNTDLERESRIILDELEKSRKQVSKKAEILSNDQSQSRAEVKKVKANQKSVRTPQNTNATSGESQDPVQYLNTIFAAQKEARKSLNSTAVKRIKAKYNLQDGNDAGMIFYNVEFNSLIEHGVLGIDENGKYFYKESGLLFEIANEKYTKVDIQSKAKELRKTILRDIQEYEESLEEAKRNREEYEDSLKKVMAKGDVLFTTPINCAKAVLEMIENL